MIDARASLLAVGCVIFAALIAAEFRVWSGIDPAPTGPRRVDAEQRSATPPASPPQLAGLVATTLARPLFSATRRPPEVAQGGSTASDLNDKRLTGIVIAPEHRFAIFAVNGAKPLILDEGDTVDGWRIERIAPTVISLRGPSGTRTLQPKIDPHLVRPPPFGPPANPAPQVAVAGALPARPASPGGFAPPPGRPAAAPPPRVFRPGQRQ